MQIDTDQYIRIFATAFLMEDERQSIEYRIITRRNCHQVNQRIHSGVKICDYLTDWETISFYTSFRDCIKEIFDRLRSMEIKSSLYKELIGTTLPNEVYSKKIDQWVDYATRLEVKCFSIHGNYSKYQPKPSPETKAFYLKVYESLKDNWQVPSITDLWLEELIKKEISLFYERHFEEVELDETSLSLFLKKYYTDYEDQIDRYMLHLDISERCMKVTPGNRAKVQSYFEHHLLRET